MLGGNFGDFVVREGTKPGTCVIVINDSGIIANLQVKINTGNGTMDLTPLYTCTVYYAFFNIPCDVLYLVPMLI